MGTLLFLALAAAAGPWRTYEVYQPRVERYFINDAHAQELAYNHDSSIAWYGDRWFCLWNANTPPEEGKPGQLNYESTSRDGRAWSPPLPAFSDARRCANPVPCPRGTQWQPNLVVVGTELWAVWSQNSRDGYNGCYVSRLRRPDGRWENERLTWNGSENPEVDGKRWRLFPTQNPVRLRSGRILAPVTMIGPAAADAPEDVTGWWATEKRDSVLYTDDGGKSWHVSPGAIQPGRSWAQWEPTVWEAPDGSVMMLSRNNDFRSRRAGGARPAEMLLWSRSADGGATWTPHAPVPLETVASRMHVLPAGGSRFVMVHNDWPAGVFVSDRRNLALFFTRGSGFAFVPGPGFTGNEDVVCYPQMWIRDGALAISYSQGRAHRSIKVAHISPLPDPNRHHLFPRTNLDAPPAPERRGDTLLFAGDQHVATRQVVDPGEDAFSAGVWVRPRTGGVLLDTRAESGRGGFVWGLSGGAAGGYSPFIHFQTKEGNLTAASLHLPYNRWSYTGVSVDGRAGEVLFHVDGKSESVRFTAPAPHPLRGATGHVGAKRLPGSALGGLSGDLRLLALIPSVRLNAAEHNGLANEAVKSLGRAPLQPAATLPAAPILRLDPSDARGFARDFELPEGEDAGCRAVEVNGVRSLRFTGEASAGVDLDENDRARGDAVRFAFRFRLEGTGQAVLCTAGDANEPARLVARAGDVLLAAGKQEVRCGKVNPAGWTAVEVRTAGTRTSASVAGGPPAEVEHHPAATWLFLGQGYRTGAKLGAFLVDVTSVRSRVEHP